MDNSRVVITVVGKDKVGIIAAVTAVLAENSVNILDISQTIMQDFFTMILVADINGCTLEYSELLKELKKTEEKIGVKITIQKEEVFNYMHRI